MKFKKITNKFFRTTYKPIKNSLAIYPAYNGCMFGTYGIEFEYVKEILKELPSCVWTVVEADGVLIICSGFHFINRCGYIITEIPCPDDTLIQVE